MCGIHAIIGKLDCIEDMVAATPYRGPDASGIWKGEGVALGHNRLAILDVSESGSQPMWSADHSVAIVYNGEIYNHRELRQRVPRYPFRSTSDTETLLALYQAEGIQFVCRLWGMFAFVLIDFHQQKAFAVRDQDGMKPLMSCHVNGAICFASELEALYRVKPPVRLSSESMSWYLSVGYVPAPYTFFEGYESLLPGEIREIDLRTDRTASTRLKQTWPIPAAQQPFDKTLAEAVERHLLSDVPVGLFLSGGLDSSALAVSLAQDLGVRPMAFHVAIPGRSDTDRARSVAQTLGLSLQELPWTLERAREAFQRAQQSLAQPLADVAYLPLLELSRAAATQVKVVLSGDGADEYFLGYGRHAFLGRAKVRYPSVFGSKVASYLPRKVRAGAARLCKTAIPAYFDAVRLSDRGIMPTAESLRQVAEERAIRTADELDARLYLPDDLLVKTDLAGMRASLEGRLPFLDPALKAYASALLMEQRRRQDVGKLPIRAFLERRGLPEVAHQGKQGFGIPMRALLGTNPELFAEPGREFLCSPEVQEIVPGLAWSERFIEREPMLAYACALAGGVVSRVRKRKRPLADQNHRPLS